MLLGTLGAGLLGNILAGKGINRAGYRNKKRDGMIRAGYGFSFKGLQFFQKNLISPILYLILK